jgi:NADH-quinone oxidoreductase E subunit
VREDMEVKLSGYETEQTVIEESSEKRSLPELSKLEELLKDFEIGDESLLIPLLQAAQNAYGYLSMKVMDRIAEHLQIPRSRAYSVSTFYRQFHLTARGENIIRVCNGTACHVKGGKNVLDVLESKLGIKAGETTEDLKFTLETVSCLGTCFLSPVMVINGEYYGKLTPKRILEILEQYK